MSSNEKTGVTLDKPVESYTLKKYIWRPYVTPFDRILNHHYEGQGTEESPSTVDWLPGAAVDLPSWNIVYKWAQRDRPAPVTR